MLKIKDDFSLEKLKDYGFKIYDSHVSDYYIKYIKNDNHCNLTIKAISRVIVLDTGANYIENLDTLYDLIKADLVEKVEEE